MSTAADAGQVPPTRDFGAAWAAYAFFAGGALLMWWPALVGLVICYVKRGAAQSGFLDSHYRWLIATFWLSLLGYLLSIAAIVAGVWPIVRDVARAAMEERDWSGTSIHIDWTAIVSTVGGATLGGLGLFAVWCWYLYRVVRGGIRLNAAQPAP